MRHEPHIRRVPAPTVFALAARTPLVLNSRIGTRKPAVQALEDIVAVVRLRGGIYALPPPEAALAAHSLGLDTNGGSISTETVRELVPQAWLDLCRQHPEAKEARVHRIWRHDTPIPHTDEPSIVLFRDCEDWHGRAEVCVQFNGPTRLHITFPYLKEDCFARHWVVAGALAAHFGFKAHRFEHFYEDIGGKVHFAVPPTTADALLRLGAWLGLAPERTAQ